MLEGQREGPFPVETPSVLDTLTGCIITGVHTQVFSLLVVELEMLRWWSSPLDDGLKLYEQLATALSSLWGTKRQWSGLAILAILANDREEMCPF